MDLRLRHWILMAPLAQSTTTFSRCAGRNFVQIKLPMIDIAGAQEINWITLDKLLFCFGWTDLSFPQKGNQQLELAMRHQICAHIHVYYVHMDVFITLCTHGCVLFTHGFEPAGWTEHYSQLSWNHNYVVLHSTELIILACLYFVSLAKT